MSTKADIIREFEQKRAIALANAGERKAALYKQCPALKELDIEAAELSREQMRRHISGEQEIGDFEKKLAAISERRRELIRASGIDIEPKFECTKCNDTGRVGTEYCSCFVNRVIAENFKTANLSVTSSGERFENFDFSFYSDTTEERYGVSPKEHMGRVYERCKAFADGFAAETKNLLLVGAPGLGKTFLSSSIAHTVLENGYTVIYLSASEFCSRIQANRFGENSAETEDFYTADLLILDDLGTEFKTGLTSSVLGDVIDRRLRTGKKMVFSTNLNLKELEKTYSARIISRFMGGFDYLQFLGRDIRLQKRGY